MVLKVVTPRSLRLGEIFAILLGLGLSTIAISARIYMKSRVLRKFLSEDYFSIAAYVGFLAYLALAIVIGKNSGETEHKAYLSMVETILYQPVIVLVKTSILLQYVTVFVVHRKNFFHWLIHVIIWGNVIFSVIITFLFIFRCEPRRKLWLPQTPGTCHDGRGRGILSGASNIVTDFLILILPLPILVRLQMPFKMKLRLLVVFGIGLFACIASVVRFVYSFYVTSRKDSVSYQLNINRQGLLAFAEIAIGIIVGCMPAAHKCYQHLAKNASSFSLRFPHSGSSGGPYWRKLFARSSSSSDAGRPGKPFASTGSGSPAPHIKTLNMTRASFTLEEGHMPTPTPPPPAAIQSSESAMTSSKEGRGPGSNSYRADNDTSEKVEDVERGIPFPIGSWQQGANADADADGDEDRMNRGKNETARAQYEFGSKR